MPLKATYKFPKQSTPEQRPQTIPYQISQQFNGISSRIFANFEGKRFFLHSLYFDFDNHVAVDVEIGNHTLIVMGVGNGTTQLKFYERTVSDDIKIESNVGIEFKDAIAFISSVNLVNARIIIKGELEL